MFTSGASRGDPKCMKSAAAAMLGAQQTAPWQCICVWRAWCCSPCWYPPVATASTGSRAAATSHARLSPLRMLRTNCRLFGKRRAFAASLAPAQRGATGCAPALAPAPPPHRLGAAHLPLPPFPGGRLLQGLLLRLRNLLQRDCQAGQRLRPGHHQGQARAAGEAGGQGGRQAAGAAALQAAPARGQA